MNELSVNRRWFFPWALVVALFFGVTSWSQTPKEERDEAQAAPQATKDVVELQTIQVEETRWRLPQSPVEGNRAMNGKKVNRMVKDEIPAVTSNQPRQLFSEMPGIILSEVNNESWLSLTTRGMGDPHESFNILTLVNHVPSVPDPHGYPAAYYSPHWEALESVEFIRTGASLLYGPHPGGAIHWHLRRARWAEKPNHRTFLGLGSFRQRSLYNESQGSRGAFAVLVSYAYRAQDGFRENNSGNRVENPRLNLGWDLEGGQKVYIDFDVYRGIFSEPGGLARGITSSTALALDNPRQVALKHDSIEIDRDQVTLSWEKERTRSAFRADFWFARFRRESFRQQVGSGFGLIPTSNQNVIQNQVFSTVGSQFRGHFSHSLWGLDQVTTFNLQGIQTFSPLTQEIGNSVTARSGTRTREMNRLMRSQAIAAENVLKFDVWRISPGFRYEVIDQEIDENLHVGSLVPLRKARNVQHVFLPGLSLERDLGEKVTAYAMLSDAFKPPAFQDVVPLQPNDTISEDIQAASVKQYELGIKRRSGEWEWDISIFEYFFTNTFGRVGTNLQNIGSVRSRGVELYSSWNFHPRWRFFLASQFLDSQIMGGPNQGRRPQYAPPYLHRVGLSYLYGFRSQVRLVGHFQGSSYGNDDNDPAWALNELQVWDLTAEHELGRWGEFLVSLNGGVLNLLDQREPSRVRANGFEPAVPRGFFLGATLRF